MSPAAIACLKRFIGGLMTTALSMMFLLLVGFLKTLVGVFRPETDGRPKAR
jgi:high-affinity nickel permease